MDHPKPSQYPTQDLHEQPIKEPRNKYRKKTPRRKTKKKREYLKRY
jgi:hypothetical protein